MPEIRRDVEPQLRMGLSCTWRSLFRYCTLSLTIYPNEASHRYNSPSSCRPPGRARPGLHRLEPAVHLTIGIKIFGIAVGLLILMAVVALLSMRMTRTVDDQLVIVDHNYFPAYVALAQANISSVEESVLIRRQIIALAEDPRDDAK